MYKVPDYLERLISEVSNNSSNRYTCPACRGVNTLGITKENGKVKWNCFRNRCELKAGSKPYSRNTSELKFQLEARTEGKETFQLPMQLVYGLSSPQARLMLNEGHCLGPYKDGLFEVAYDPVQDRVCFIIKKDKEIIGLIGKACNRKTNPKVLNYGNVAEPFIVGASKDILVIVEDCISAASCCRINRVSGMAILGSTLKPEYIPVTRIYNKIVVALDRDARKKALAIKRKLCYYHQNVKLWMLEKDIKDMSDVELFTSFSTI